MKVSVIWIDREHARFFLLSEEKMERQKIDAHHQSHHTHAESGVDHMRNEHPFFGNCAGILADADKILIIGPGMAKHHFQNFLTEHHPALGKKVAAVETVDHPTDGQIAALARKFFERVSA